MMYRRRTVITQSFGNRGDTCGTSLKTAWTVTAVACAVVLLVQQSIQARQAGTRAVLVVVPAQSASTQLVRVTADDGPAVTVDRTQSIDVRTGKPVSLVCTLSSGLTLRTTLIDGETSITLPTITKDRLVVTDSAGVGVVDAKVTARGVASRWTWTNTVISGLNGLARIEHPETSGRDVARVDAEGFTPYEAEIALASNHDAHISLIAGATIAGTVLTQQATAGQTIVRLVRVTTTRDRVQQSLIETTFAWRNVAAGEYVIEALVKGSGMRSIGPILVKAGQYVNLGPIDVTPSAALEGVVHDEDGAPLINARVRLTPIDDVHVALAEAVTDRSGRYRFAAVIPGEYRPELFVEGSGWRTFPFEPIVLTPGEAKRRSLAWSKDCSLAIRFNLMGALTDATYSISLPVTERPTTFRVSSESVEQRFAAVPCEGAAVIARRDSAGETYFIPLVSGANEFVVSVWPPKAPVSMQVLTGGQPLSGVSVWTMPHGSPQTVAKTTTGPMTDETGTMIVSIPSEEAPTLYLQGANGWSEVDRAEFRRDGSRVILSLPGTIIRGRITDSRGRPLAGVTFLGTIKDSDGSSQTLPPSAVTLFKGRSDQEGAFFIPGVAVGQWSIQLLRQTQTQVSRTVDVDVRERSAAILNVIMGDR